VGDIELVAIKTARGLTFFIVIGFSSAGAFAGWSAYGTRSPAVVPKAAQSKPIEVPEPVVSNKQAKGDRLAPARMVLASADPTVSAMPVTPAPAVVRAAAVPLPSAKPKIPAAQTAHAASGAIDESQIAHVKARLRLTRSQEQYWPAVEAALRDVIRQHAREARRTGARRGAPSIDTNSPEVQRLTFAAMPLLMQLREDQKHEVRKFARTIGLDHVASQI
jgi:hypothetical protein